MDSERAGARARGADRRGARAPRGALPAGAGAVPARPLRRGAPRLRAADRAGGRAGQRPRRPRSWRATTTTSAASPRRRATRAAAARAYRRAIDLDPAYRAAGAGAGAPRGGGRRSRQAQAHHRRGAARPPRARGPDGRSCRCSAAWRASTWRIGDRARAPSRPTAGCSARAPDSHDDRVALAELSRRRRSTLSLAREELHAGARRRSAPRAGLSPARCRSTSAPASSSARRASAPCCRCSATPSAARAAADASAPTSSAARSPTSCAARACCRRRCCGAYTEALRRGARDARRRLPACRRSRDAMPASAAADPGLQGVRRRRAAPVRRRAPRCSSRRRCRAASLLFDAPRPTVFVEAVAASSCPTASGASCSAARSSRCAAATRSSTRLRRGAARRGRPPARAADQARGEREPQAQEFVKRAAAQGAEGARAAAGRGAPGALDRRLVRGARRRRPIAPACSPATTSAPRRACWRGWAARSWRSRRTARSRSARSRAAPSWCASSCRTRITSCASTLGDPTGRL